VPKLAQRFELQKTLRHVLECLATHVGRPAMISGAC